VVAEGRKGKEDRKQNTLNSLEPVLEQAVLISLTLLEHPHHLFKLLVLMPLSTTQTLQRKSHLCIPRKGIVRPQSQFPHSCVSERFIYSKDWPTYFPAAE
jgi:hypothetical protein